ncbi:hypothetical protein, partial [Pseudomonas aeruginosa]|uniref:hypothetical protein n=1 Tax=Pseudomonas aeruginosa TaxID=287 RepID=UPI002B40EB7A
TRQESATNDINISLVHNFKKEGQKATFELGYINANQYSTRPFNSKLYVNNNLQNDNNYKTDGGTKNNIYTGKIDFSSSFKKINF